MSEETGFDLLSEHWPVKCSQCGKQWADAPLIAIAIGNTPVCCPDCMSKFLKLLDAPPKEAGTVITFKGWKP